MDTFNDCSFADGKQMTLAYYTINCCNISAITHTVTKMQRMFPCLTTHSKLYPVLSHQKLESNFSHDSIYSAGKLSLTVCSLNKGLIAWKLTPLINLMMDVQFVGQSLLEKNGISYYQSIQFWKKKNSENPNSIYSQIIMLSSHHHWSRWSTQLWQHQVVRQ